MREFELYRSRIKSSLFVKKAIFRTKNFLCKTFLILRSIMFQGCKNGQPMTSHSNPFMNTIPDSTIKEMEDFYRIWSEQWESNSKLNQSEAHADIRGVDNKDFAKEQTLSAGNNNNNKSNKKKGERVIGFQKNIERGEAFSQSKGSSRSLAQRMEELEMMDMEDVDQVMDVEEVLHFYSKLNCPIYLDIVDTFFTDMYTEFNIPQPTLSHINSSRRSLGPIKL